MSASSVFAGLRFPAAATLSLLFIASLFWALWSATAVKFTYRPLTATPIEFTRLLRDSELTTKYQQKVERVPPPVLPTVPQIRNTRAATDGGPALVPLVPEVVTGGNLPMSPGTDRDVVPLVRIEPEYPPRAARAGTEGWVLVQYNISAAGAVTDALVVDNAPSAIFDEAALKAVSRWRYNPKVADGVPVERRGMQTLIRFALEEE